MKGAQMLRVINQLVVLTLAVAAFGGSLLADTKYGAGVTLVTATPISALYASPEKFVGKTVRVDGVVTAVCTAEGCWMALGTAGNPDQAVRFQAEHDGKIVFPMSLMGKKASAEGVFVKIGDEGHGREAAGEHAHAQPNAADFGRRYQFQVTGAVAP